MAEGSKLRETAGDSTTKATSAAGTSKESAARDLAGSGATFVTPEDVAAQYDEAAQRRASGDGYDPAADPTVSAGDVDRVSMVSRTKAGDPDQTPAFQVVVPTGASDEHKAAALNEPAGD